MSYDSFKRPASTQRISPGGGPEQHTAPRQSPPAQLPWGQGGGVSTCRGGNRGASFRLHQLSFNVHRR